MSQQDPAAFRFEGPRRALPWLESNSSSSCASTGFRFRVQEDVAGASCEAQGSTGLPWPRGLASPLVGADGGKAACHAQSASYSAETKASLGAKAAFSQGSGFYGACQAFGQGRGHNGSHSAGCVQGATGAKGSKGKHTVQSHNVRGPNVPAACGAQPGFVTSGVVASGSHQAAENHRYGRCKPCVYQHTGGCRKHDCNFCHLEHDQLELRRVRPSKNTRRCLYRRLQRQQAGIWEDAPPSDEETTHAGRFMEGSFAFDEGRPKCSERRDPGEECEADADDFEGITTCDKIVLSF